MSFFLYAYVVALFATIVTGVGALAYVLVLGPLYVLLIPIAAVSPLYLIYSTPIGIVVTYTRGVLSKGRIVAVSLSALALTAAAPGLASRLYVQRQVSSLEAFDFSQSIRQRPRSIELTFTLRDQFKNVLYNAACTALCQKLLIGREVDAVRVSAVDSDGKAENTVTYRLGMRTTCPVAFANATRVLDYTKWLDRQGSCIIPEIGAPEIAGTLKVALYTPKSGWRYVPLPEVKKLRREVSVRRLEPGYPIWGSISHRSEA